MYFFRMLPSSSFTLAVYWVWQSSPEQQWGTGLDWEHSGVTGLIFIIRLHLIFCLRSGNFIWEVWAFVDKASLMPCIVWGFRWLLYRRSKCTADQAEWRGKGQTKWAAHVWKSRGNLRAFLVSVLLDKGRGFALTALSSACLSPWR